MNNINSIPATTISTGCNILAVKASAANEKKKGAKLAPSSPEHIISGVIIDISSSSTIDIPASILAGAIGPIFADGQCLSLRSLL